MLAILEVGVNTEMEMILSSTLQMALITAIGAYSEENRLEYIEYNWYDPSAELSQLSETYQIHFIPSSGLHFLLALGR